MAYNHSKFNRADGEKILREPTDQKAGRVRSLHARKGWRYSRIAPLNATQKPTLARRLLDFLTTRKVSI